MLTESLWMESHSLYDEKSEGPGVWPNRGLPQTLASLSGPGPGPGLRGRWAPSPSAWPPLWGRFEF